MKAVPLSKAEKVLKDAGATIRKRLKQHGHTESSFTMIASLWSNYIHHTVIARGNTKLLPQDVAQMMVLVKIARSVYGFSPDNFEDSAGYTALAAMLTPPTGK